MSDVLMDELRARFRETTQVRLRDMYALLAALERDSHDANTVEKLLRHFHALAGLGATYGYPRVSELGDEGERLFGRDAVPDARTLERWRELMDEAERQLC